MYRVPNPRSFRLDPLRLAAERGRLVRFCTRQVGNAQVAEDLAQETLLIAWERHKALRDGDVWQAWLTGIARNVCLRYLRRIGIDQKRLVSADSQESVVSFEMVPDTSLPDLDELLEQDDIARLLEAAIERLPAETQMMLVDRYLLDMPIEEIAARRGVRQETATVQLYRSRQALKRALTASELRSQTAALGLVAPEALEWQVTRLWCPDCGMHHLEGMFCYSNKESSTTLVCPRCQSAGSCSCSGVIRKPQNLAFALRCPYCIDRAKANGEWPSPLVHMGNAHMLEGVKGFKPALNRVNRWWQEYTESLLESRRRPCLRCGHTPVGVTTSCPADFPWSAYHGKSGLFAKCPRCASVTAIEVHEIARQTEAGQEFWKQNPRFRTLPHFTVPSDKGNLLVTRLESVQNSKAIEIVLHAQTMQVERVLHLTT